MCESKHFTIRLEPGDDLDLPPEKAKRLINRASRFRGEVVNQMVFIEHKLTEYLARCFRDMPKKRAELDSMKFNRKARIFQAIVAMRNVPTPADDLIYLGEFRDTLAHGTLIYETRTGRLKIDNRKTLKVEILTGTLRSEIDKKVIRVDEFLNSLLAVK